MTENFPLLVKKIDQQAQDSQRIPNKMNPKWPTPSHIIIKIPTVKTKRILKAAREKQLVTYKGAPVRPLADYSTETFKAKRNWNKIFKVTKRKDLQPRLLSKAII